MSTTNADITRMDADVWLERRRTERRRRVRLMRLRLAASFAALSGLMLVFQLYEILMWAFIATMLVSFLGLGRTRRR